MSLIHRQLIALDMLAQDLSDELNSVEIQQELRVSAKYLALLSQYLKASQVLLQQGADLRDYEFVELVRQHGVCTHLVSKKLLLVQNRLLNYVLEIYQTNDKLDEIRDTDFSEQAEVRFDLLTTKVIKAKSQYRTVAKAMVKKDYQGLIQAIGLAEFDWGWEQI